MAEKGVCGTTLVGMKGELDRIYSPAIKYVVKNRYFTLSLGSGVFIVSMGLIAGGVCSVCLFARTDSDWIVAEVVYPLGTPF